MFASFSCNEQRPQPYYLKKKKLLYQQIRKEQRNQIKAKLRQNAVISQSYMHLIHRLPDTIKQTIDIIQKIEGQHRLKQIIAQQILSCLKISVKSIFNLELISHVKQNLVLIFLIRMNLEGLRPFLDQIFQTIQKDKQRQDLMMLFGPLTTLLKKNQTFALHHGKQLLKTVFQNKYNFCYEILLFYDILLRKYEHQCIELNFFDDQLLRRLSDHLSIQFYSTEERIKMVQILIQILYKNKQDTVSTVFDIDSLFTSLQYYIGYSKSQRLLTERCLILVFNLNIDRGSKQFVYSKCFETIRNQIKNHHTPYSLKKLMVQVYLSVFVNYPKNGFLKFMKIKQKQLFDLIAYCCEQFSDDSEMITIIVDFLNDLLHYCQHEEIQQIKIWLKNHQECMHFLMKNEQSAVLLEHWEII